MDRKYLILIMICSLLIIPISAINTTTVTIYATNSSDTDFLRSVHNTTYTDLRDGAGMSYHETTSTLAAYIQSDLATDTFYRLYRSAISFNTSIIPDNATVTSATIGLYRFSNYTTLGDTAINIVKFNTEGNFSADDYNNFGNILFSTNKSASSLTTAQYYNFSLNPDGIQSISLTGNSSFGIEFGFDLDNVTPTWVSGGSKYSGAAFYAADNVVNIPFIEITYTTPTYTQTFTPSSDSMISYGAANTSLFSTLRNAAIGTSADSAYTYCYPRLTAESSPTEQWYYNYRCAFIFDISSIPDNAVNITSEIDVYKYYRTTTLGDIGIAPVVFNIDGGLDTADYNNFDYTNVSPMQNASTPYGYNNWTMNKTMNDHIATKLTGSVGIGLLHQSDITGVAPTWVSGGSAFGQFRTVDNVTDIPQLRISYDVPYTVSTIYPMKYINDTRILQNSDVGLPAAGLNLTINSTPGEITQGSFVIKVPTAVSDMSVNASGMTNETGGVMNTGILNITLIKNWWQSGNNYTYTSYVTAPSWVLTPELCMHNISVVRADLTAQTNEIWVENATFTGYVHIDNTSIGQWKPDYKIIDNPSANGMPIPFALPSGHNMQVMIKTMVPAGTPAGNYTGKIFVNSSDTLSTAVNFTVRVLPFILQNNSKIHSFYNIDSMDSNLGVWDGRYAQIITESNYTMMLRNLKEHGILHPQLQTSTSGYWGTVTETMLDLRDAEDFPKDSLFFMGYNFGYDTTDPIIPQSNAQIANAVTQVQTAYAAANGTHKYIDVYFYGRDEGAQSTQIYDRPLHENITANSGKVYASVSTNITYLADQLGASVGVSGTIGDGGFPTTVDGTWYNLSIRNTSHFWGQKALVYSTPQVGLEYPETYRKNFGLGLVKWDFDGGMDYQWYRHTNISSNTTWNEYQYVSGSTGAFYKPGGMVYPKFGGYVDTLSYEGYREGTNDQRYADTLTALTGSNVMAIDTISAGFKDKQDMQEIRYNLTTLILNELNSPPTSNFTGYPLSGTSPLTVNFTDESTNAPTSWSWAYNNGTGWKVFPTNNTAQNPIVKLPAGLYDINLTATNDVGSDNEIKLSYLNIMLPVPVAAFSANNTSICAGSTVQFTDNSTNNPDSWYWEFDASNTSILQNPTFQYNVTGLMNVSLKVNNTGGYDWENKTGYITVSDCSSPLIPLSDFNKQLADKMNSVQGFIVICIYIIIGVVVIASIAKFIGHNE